ncbi:DUF397 domain-containing protein [Streptomyces sp. NPDC058665]|uniref:DUF397 domain-containing protein n=1 Tax=Streptomyces sp. NPDC058665 TaxID=3346586 RepID=UPI0036486820
MSYSGDFEDACVEAHARPDGDGVLIRDSKDRARRRPWGDNHGGSSRPSSGRRGVLETLPIRSRMPPWPTKSPTRQPHAPS